MMLERWWDYQGRLCCADQIAKLPMGLLVDTALALDYASRLTKGLSRPTWLPERRRHRPRLEGFVQAIVEVGGLEGRRGEAMEELRPEQKTDFESLCMKCGVVPMQWGGEGCGGEGEGSSPAHARAMLRNVGSGISKWGSVARVDVLTRAVADVGNLALSDVCLVLESLAHVPRRVRRPFLDPLLRRAKQILYRPRGTVARWGSETLPAVRQWRVQHEGEDQQSSTPLLPRAFSRHGDYTVTGSHPAEILRLVTALAALELPQEKVFAEELLHVVKQGDSVTSRSGAGEVPRALRAIALLTRSESSRQSLEETLLHLEYAVTPHISMLQLPQLCELVENWATVEHHPQCLSRLYSALSKLVSSMTFLQILAVLKGVAFLQGDAAVLLAQIGSALTQKKFKIEQCDMSDLFRSLSKLPYRNLQNGVVSWIKDFLSSGVEPNGHVRLSVPLCVLYLNSLLLAERFVTDPKLDAHVVGHLKADIADIMQHDAMYMNALFRVTLVHCVKNRELSEILHFLLRNRKRLSDDLFSYESSLSLMEILKEPNTEKFHADAISFLQHTLEKSPISLATKSGCALLEQICLYHSTHTISPDIRYVVTKKLTKHMDYMAKVRPAEFNFPSAHKRRILLLNNATKEKIELFLMSVISKLNAADNFERTELKIV